MKYWSISFKLDLHYQCVSTKKYDYMLSRINYIMIFLNITIPIWEAIFEGLDKPGTFELVFEISFYALILI